MAMAETNSGDDAEVMRLRNLVKDLEQQNTVLRSQKLSKPANSFSGGGESSLKELLFGGRVKSYLLYWVPVTQSSGD